MIIRTNSHRCRSKVACELDRHPRYFWTWEAGAVFALVTRREYARVRNIKGVTRARVDRKELRPCLTWD